MFVNAPVAGVEKLDFKAVFDGRPVLDNTPIMYWYLSDDRFEQRVRAQEASAIGAALISIFDFRLI
jgi:hypothetical protein